jgi:branched-chain amino acid transport system substrate-binding protein
MRRRAALLVALVLPLGACGTRMSADRIAAADGTAFNRTAASATAPPSFAAGSSTITGPATSQAATGTAGVRTGPATAAAPPISPDRASSTRSASRDVPPAGATGGPDGPCAQQLAPVVLGQTAPVSGIIGATDYNMRAGLALWLREVNARGGVQCHPVTLYQMDDAADPARVTANLNELVNNKKAIAIVGAGVPTTFPAAKRFAEQNEVPFVGGDLIEPGWWEGHWFFPQGGSPLASYAGAMKEAAAAAHTNKIGLVYCVEAAICGQINAHFDAMAKASGLEVVLRKVSSITAPDYTAECQALKSAGAGTVFVALESSGNTRLARSCRSLGYEPTIATSATAITAEAGLDENLKRLGVFLGAANAPFPAVDTVGTRAFRATFDRYSPGAPVDQNSISQYASGRLFEAAIATVYERARNGPITRELLLDGLWRVKDETLDGLAPPVTFTRNGPPAANDCYALLNLAVTGYAAPHGSRFGCFRGLPTGF